MRRILSLTHSHWSCLCASRLAQAYAEIVEQQNIVQMQTYVYIYKYAHWNSAILISTSRPKPESSASRLPRAPRFLQRPNSDAMARTQACLALGLVAMMMINSVSARSLFEVFGADGNGGAAVVGIGDPTPLDNADGKRERERERGAGKGRDLCFFFSLLPLGVLEYAGVCMYTALMSRPGSKLSSLVSHCCS